MAWARKIGHTAYSILPTGKRGFHRRRSQHF
jgi:hypothetical protein